MNNNRLVEFDCARALAMLYIVGVWHMLQYMSINIDSIKYIGRILEIISFGSLCTFTFISAFFLSKNSINNMNDFVSFYKRRFFRFYSLFFIVCCTLLYMSSNLFDTYKNKIYIVSFKQFAMTLLGLGTFFDKAPRTVWYASMIIFFYYIIPIVLYRRKNIYFFYLLFFVAFLWVISKVTLFSVDPRFFVHCILFFFVIYMSCNYRDVILNIINNNFFYLINIISFICILLISIVIHSSRLLLGGGMSSIIIIYYSVISFLGISKIMMRINFIRKITYYMSYASMIVYLFHRQYFEIMVKFLGPFSVLSAIFVLFVLIIICFYFQKTYDGLINNYFLKK